MARSANRPYSVSLNADAGGLLEPTTGPLKAKRGLMPMQSYSPFGGVVSSLQREAD